MIKYTLLLSILALRLFYQPSAAQDNIAPFASPTPLSTTTVLAPAKLVDFTASVNKNKVMLNWAVDENETAAQFEVEKSTDGTNFSMVALVFGTDKPTTDNYAFYEKAGKKKVLYRIKLVNKNKQTEYSSVLTINPVV